MYACTENGSLIETSTAHITALQPVLTTPERRLDIMVIATAGRSTVINLLRDGGG